MSIKNTYPPVSKHKNKVRKITEHLYVWPMDGNMEFELTAEDIREFEERRRRGRSGESRTYTLEEAIDLILNKKNLL